MDFSLFQKLLFLGIDWQVRPPLPGHPVPPKASPNQALHFNTSVANLVVLRGKDVQSVDLGEKKYTAH